MEKHHISKFWSKVAKAGPLECWEWKAGISGTGYGAFWHAGKTLKAHRVALELSGAGNGNGLLCTHSCDNRKCCNPAHLKWGTSTDNVREMFQRNKEHVNANKNHMRALGLKSKFINQKLKQSQVDYMRRLLAAGYSQDLCAKWYGVCQMTVSKISRGVTYQGKSC